MPATEYVNILQPSDYPESENGLQASVELIVVGTVNLSYSLTSYFDFLFFSFFGYFALTTKPNTYWIITHNEVKKV